MKKILSLLLTLSLVLALCACGGDASNESAADDTQSQETAAAEPAGDSIELIMSIGTSQNLKDGADKFKELVEEASNGTITITIYADSVLGDDRVATETTQFGDIDIAVCVCWCLPQPPCL